MSDLDASKGFVYGLFVPELASSEVSLIDKKGNSFLNSFQENGPSQLMQPIENYKEMRNFRVLKNLGSRLQDVKAFDSDDKAGYQVLYD